MGNFNHLSAQFFHFQWGLAGALRKEKIFIVAVIENQAVIVMNEVEVRSRKIEMILVTQFSLSYYFIIYLLLAMLGVFYGA